MKPRYYAGVLGIALAASAASLAAAGSTATITQGNGGSFVSRTFSSPGGQTIIQRSGGNRAVITQRASRGDPRHAQTAYEGGSDMLVHVAPEDQRDLQAMARDEGTSVQALVEEAIQDFLDRNR